MIEKVKINNVEGEVYKFQTSGVVSSPKEALEFVKNRKNIFSDFVRRRLVFEGPDFFIVKEIERFREIVNVWFWKVLKEGGAVILKFNNSSVRKIRKIEPEVIRFLKRV